MAKVSADVAAANKKPFWSKAGEQTPADLRTHDGAVPNGISSEAGLMGVNASGILQKQNADMYEPYDQHQAVKTQFHRGQIPAEANGPRLSVSPSGKIPTNELPSGYNVNPKIVQSRIGNGSRSLFDAGTEDHA